MKTHRHDSTRRLLLAGTAVLVSIVLTTGCSSPEKRPSDPYEEFLARHEEKGWVEITPEIATELRKARDARVERLEQSPKEVATATAVEDSSAPAPVQPPPSPPVTTVEAEPSAGVRVEKDPPELPVAVTDPVSDPGPTTATADVPEPPRNPASGQETEPATTPPAKVTTMTPADAPPVVPPPDATASPGSVPESLELRNIPLTDMVRLVARHADMDIIVPDGLDQKVTLSLKGTEPLVALQSVLDSHGFEIIENPPGLFVVRPKPEEQVPQQTRSFTLTSVPVDKVEEDLRKILSPAGKIVLNPNRNSFLMLDYPENLELMDQFVRLLDVREKQVLVEATIMEVRLANNDQIGMLLNFMNIQLDDVTGDYFQDLLPEDRAFTIGLASNKDPFSGILEAIATMEALNIISTPKVATINGETAVIEVIEKIPYIDSTATTTTETGGVGSTTIQQVEFEEVGVTLTIRPTIGEDDIIKLKITPEVKELRGFFEGIPVTERRRVDTTVLVRSGGCVVIGGLLRENEFVIENKVPFLGDIPFIGAAFRFRQRRLEKNELLILVTPHLISVEEDSMAEEAIDHLEKTKKEFERGGLKRSFDLIW